MHRTSLTLRLVIPAIWLGLIIGISFFETPLKFQAPGITLELGLGIGRLVFYAMNTTALVLAALLTLAMIRPRATRLQWGLLAGLWAVLLTQILVIRPPLNARTDAVVAGSDVGGSLWHYFYIAADGSTFVLLIVFIVVTAHLLIPAVAPRQGA
ncbi:hypothetical protein ESZ53_01665 [Salinibacterium sp. UTAS2018]|uniref:hypothetical protein n=1 Tax=Salinibacterium sp. UTAS2018 TaxID=2508880 RepID=UPI0010097E48|nr:hypothetical protein [Salinibacterium sp. UTAS2018]QAV69259.1 hypothetical protein ESZ53_01665 [Salinibacterium sp. UTAS2018]